MKFCKLFRFFNHTLQNQKRRKFSLLRNKQPPKVFCEKGVLKNFPIFTGKYLYWSPF